MLAYWTIRPRLMASPAWRTSRSGASAIKQYQVLVDPRPAARATASRSTQVMETTADALDAGCCSTPTARRSAPAGSSTRPTSGSPSATCSPIDDAGGPGQGAGRDPSATARRCGWATSADVVEDHQPLIGDAVINDGPGLLLIVEKQPWGNTLDVTQRRRGGARRAAARACRASRSTRRSSGPATFIERSLDNLTRGAARSAACWSILILVAFLFDWRTALISLIGDPALAGRRRRWCSYLRGATINTMVLAGLVIAIGEVVDDAIIDVENIVRRLRQNRAAGSAASAVRVVLDASLEVRSAVVYASLIVIAGRSCRCSSSTGCRARSSGRWRWPTCWRSLASLLVALTVTPALSLMLLPERAARAARVAAGRACCKRGYARDPAARSSAGRARRCAIGWRSSSLAGAARSARARRGVPAELQGERLPDALGREAGHVARGDAADHRCSVSKELRAIPGVRNFGSHIGRAEVADEVVGVELHRALDQRRPDGRLRRDAWPRSRTVVDGYPGLYRDVLTYLKERIKEVLTGAERRDRRADLRARPGGAARQGGGGRARRSTSVDGRRRPARSSRRSSCRSSRSSSTSSRGAAATA